eukprot:TRINITY_DN57120_c0_g1_i1.p1 TRINITY_DN57120_c0_g1~~TRINITY_DN57120_c0_g1_i1.p1  ORF type:complete len:272 (-),score=31.34 TRINITY_DN57120_c0_g1_i1:187-1002(-)
MAWNASDDGEGGHLETSELLAQLDQAWRRGATPPRSHGALIASLDLARRRIDESALSAYELVCIGGESSGRSELAVEIALLFLVRKVLAKMLRSGMDKTYPRFRACFQTVTMVEAILNDLGLFKPEPARQRSTVADCQEKRPDNNVQQTVRRLDSADGHVRADCSIISRDAEHRVRKRKVRRGCVKRLENLDIDNLMVSMASHLANAGTTPLAVANYFGSICSQIWDAGVNGLESLSWAGSELCQISNLCEMCRDESLLGFEEWQLGACSD